MTPIGEPFKGLFKGKCVLVTGASMGIGLAIAKAFARGGADLAILAENEAIYSAADEIAAETKEPAAVFRCDIADQAAVAEAIGSLARVDALINIAGYQPATPIFDPSTEVDADFRRTMDINVTGTWYVTREAVKRMGSGGKIVFTSSIWGKTAAAKFAGYVASKHATIGLMRSLAVELAPKGINVNAVCPGWVKTEGALWTMREEAKALGKTIDEYIGESLAWLPIPGMMEPEALAPMYLFLASELARDITGQAFNVDRGSFFG
jgi:3-hydroxybutyrate dehydrogenase